MAEYKNFEHYLENKNEEPPKETFKVVASYLEEHSKRSNVASALDIGCAAGDLLQFISRNHGNIDLVGIDVFQELLVVAEKKVPRANFINASVLSMPSSFTERFDFVSAVGVMSIFNEDEVNAFWENLVRVTRPGGMIVVLSPLNEYGVDAIIKHRKRSRESLLAWETGWNIFSVETIEEIVNNLNHEVEFEKFRFTGHLNPQSDPVRTWTLPTKENSYQLTNGIKLLVDHYFMVVRRC